MDILDFARHFLIHRDVRSYGDVRTEDLAETFREWAGLSPFPTTHDLRLLFGRLGIPVATARLGYDLLGVNVWSRREPNPRVVISDRLVGMRLRSTLGHELREIIENALGRVSSSYRGIQTHDNATMNRKSDRFAACLIL